MRNNLPAAASWRAIGAIVIASATSGCGSEEHHTAGMTYWCVSRWDGDISYDGSDLTVKACLQANQCSGNLEVPRVPSAPEPCPELSDVDPPSGTCGGVPLGPQHPAFNVRTYWSSDSTPDLTVMLQYGLEVSNRLSENDRGSLLVLGESGEAIVESVSEIPYSGARCKVVALNLDGTPQE
jgi:hypothetical protein